jgi:xylan 1,4-beta-xylosidase
MPRKLLLLVLVITTSAAAQVNITVDLNKPIAPWKPITAWFGYDESNYTTTPNGQALLRELHDAYPVPVYIRAHHLLTSGNGKPELKWSSTNVFTLDTQGKPVYDFTILDQIFDAFQNAGVRPMVEFGFMPEALASGKPPYQTHYPKPLDGSSQSPPKDYAAWGELCRVFTAHMVQRYGKAETAQWYWEVWNEPNISYWHGSEADYNKLYDFAVAGVRTALPNALVGGPATTSPRSKQAADFLDAFLKHVANDKSLANNQAIPLDFISFHVKGSPKLIKAADATPEHVQMGIDKELTDADKGFALVASYAQFRALPIILSEADPEGCAACSAKENPANNYRNGTLYPAYTAAAIKGLFELQDRHSVNLISMLTWSFEFEGKDYFQGYRTLATNQVDKPILNLFRMAGKMSGQRVATTSSAQLPLETLIANGAHPQPDIDALATKDARSAAVLVWNYADDDLAAEAATVTLRIDGLPTNLKTVRVTHYRIDDTHSNAYTAWLRMGSPQKPTGQQVAELKQSGQLQTEGEARAIAIEDGRLNLPISLPRQATSLLLINW